MCFVVSFYWSRHNKPSTNRKETSVRWSASKISHCLPCAHSQLRKGVVKAAFGLKMQIFSAFAVLLAVCSVHAKVYFREEFLDGGKCQCQMCGSLIYFMLALPFASLYFSMLQPYHLSKNVKMSVYSSSIFIFQFINYSRGGISLLTLSRPRKLIGPSECNSFFLFPQLNGEVVGWTPNKSLTMESLNSLLATFMAMQRRTKVKMSTEHMTV